MKMSRSILMVAGSLAIVTPVAAGAATQPDTKPAVTVTFTEAGNEGQLPAPQVTGYSTDSMHPSVDGETSSVTLDSFFASAAREELSYTYNLLEPGAEEGTISDQVTFRTGGAYGSNLFILFTSDPRNFTGNAYDWAVETGSLMSIPLPHGDNGLNANYTLSVSAESESGAVPEPATWALMLLGFGGIGMAMRRRRRPSIAQVA